MWSIFVWIVLMFCVQWADGSLWPNSDGLSEGRVKSDFMAIELGGTPTPTDFTFDMATKAQFLIAHNGIRSRVAPPASNMLFMLWNGELEYSAQQWVDKCQWGRDPSLNIHDFDIRYASAEHRTGQNIFAMDDKTMKNLSLKARDIVGEWAAESNYYYYNSPTRYCTYDICGNYTQIVWANSLYVGCASKLCPRLDGSGLTSSAQLIVCNYSPGGNIKGTQPYEIGQPCSKCPDGFQHCVENLCEAFPRCQPVKECEPVNASTCLCVVGAALSDSDSHDGRLSSSASSDEKTEGASQRTRHRRSAKVEILTQKMRIAFLQTHNKIRSDATGVLHHTQPTAAGMMKMYWSAELEASAVSWSMTCPPSSKPHGQTNMTKTAEFRSAVMFEGWLGQTAFRSSPIPDPTAMILSFGEETKFFTLNETGGITCRTGEMCTHYTQVMWQKSYLVGCGYATCGDTHFSTCNYSPGGNYKGSAPYKTGAPCSLCSSDKKYGFTECEGKLCVPKDRCSPVKTCTVVDQTNCLCSPSSYEEIVTRMNTDAGPSIMTTVISVDVNTTVISVDANTLRARQLGGAPSLKGAPIFSWSLCLFVTVQIRSGACLN